ncbi:MAG: NAD(P)H-dependent oxidoreductase [Saprospiraceae bacterium]|nr:NAD(P)H-dependent oxidoreductase [Saprospiraceae bacterium]
MKKVLAFGASNSKTSINKVLATYAAQKLKNVQVIIADLNDYEAPLYSPDREIEIGIPEPILRFDELLASVDGLIISLAEYNGNYTTAFKNLFDWLSRLNNQNIWKNKPLLLLATSPGGRGAMNVLKITKEIFPFFGGNIIADFSLPKYYENFHEGNITDVSKRAELNGKIVQFIEVLKTS